MGAHEHLGRGPDEEVSIHGAAGGGNDSGVRAENVEKRMKIIDQQGNAGLPEEGETWKD